MEKTATVDWMSFTNRTGKPITGYVAPDFLMSEVNAATSPRFGYRNAVKFDSGAVIYYDGSTQTMGQHHVFSGQAISSLLLRGYSPDDLAKWYTDNRYVCTRLDLAVDVYDDDSFMQTTADAVYMSQYRGSARSASIIHSPTDGGMTIYMGSRTSEKFVRIYDKGVQTGKGGLWARVEVEIKGDMARFVLAAIVDGINGDVSMMAQSVIESTCKFDTPNWKAVFDGKPIKLVKPQPDEPDTKKWLLGQVVSAIVTYEREHPGERILDQIVNLVQNRGDQRTGS